MSYWRKVNSQETREDKRNRLIADGVQSLLANWQPAPKRPPLFVKHDPTDKSRPRVIRRRKQLIGFRCPNCGGVADLICIEMNFRRDGRTALVYECKGLSAKAEMLDRKGVQGFFLHGFQPKPDACGWQSVALPHYWLEIQRKQWREKARGNGQGGESD